MARTNVLQIVLFFRSMDVLGRQTKALEAMRNIYIYKISMNQ